MRMAAFRLGAFLIVLVGVLLGLASFGAQPAAARCMKWMPNDTGHPDMYCPYCWTRVGTGYQCPCPDGSWATSTIFRNNVFIATCPSQPARQRPRIQRPRPRYIPQPRYIPRPQGQDLPRTCMSGREMHDYLNGGMIWARSLRSGREWRGEFQTSGRVIFKYASGKTETNYWSIVGYAILLRRRPGGRVIARRKICTDGDRRYFWTNYETGKWTSIITDYMSRDEAENPVE